MDGAIERLLAGALCDVQPGDVVCIGLEVHAGEGRVFAACPDSETRDAVADLLVRAIRAADELADESVTTVGAVLDDERCRIESVTAREPFEAKP